MKDEELKIEENEDSLTPGGYRRCRSYSVVRYTIVNRSPRNWIPEGDRFGCEKKPMDLCVFESEEREDGVGAGANTTLLSDTLQSIGLAESAAARAKVYKKTMDLCARARSAWSGSYVIFFFNELCRTVGHDDLLYTPVNLLEKSSAGDFVFEQEPDVRLNSGSSTCRIRKAEADPAL
jgi:hypothetical protein